MGKELLFIEWFSEPSSLNFRVSPDKEANTEFSGRNTVYVVFPRGKVVVVAHIYWVYLPCPAMC